MLYPLSYGGLDLFIEPKGVVVDGVRSLTKQPERRVPGTVRPRVIRCTTAQAGGRRAIQW